MKMRKVVSAMLVAAMATGMVAGCGSSSDSKSDKKDGSYSTKPRETIDPEARETETPEEIPLLRYFCLRHCFSRSQPGSVPSTCRINGPAQSRSRKYSWRYSIFLAGVVMEKN